MRPVVIISEFPLHCEALKAMVKEVVPFRVVVYSDLASGIPRAIRRNPALVLIDSPYLSPRELEPFFEHSDEDIKLVAINMDRNKMVVYSRSSVLDATMDSLGEIMKSIEDNVSKRYTKFIRTD